LGDFDRNYFPTTYVLPMFYELEPEYLGNLLARSTLPTITSMSYRALLFCADEKASRAVTQVFRELDFQVETGNEPFDAVKRLTAQHFDALVVDCDNEENASLLFKSARNSASNNNSLAVAVVQGQANIAKAFRLGANLVLTKPINLEQAKGTLRVARGLLRKAEANKVNATSGAQAEVAPIELPGLKEVQKSVLTPLPVEIPAPVASSTLEVEKEQLPEPGPTEAAFLESVPKTVVAEASTPSTGQAAAAAPAKESHWASKPEVLEPKPVTADEVKKPKQKEEPKLAAPVAKRTESPAKSAAPRFASLGINLDDESANAEASKKNFWIAAIIVLVLGGGAYFGWAKYHPAIHLPLIGEDAPVPPPPAPPLPKPPATQTSETDPAATAAGTTPGPGANSATAPVASVPTDARPVESIPSASPATSKAPGLVKVPESVAEGLLIKKVDPNYPDQAREQKLEGLVQLRANINKSGDVTDVKAVHGNAILAEAASNAVKQWKYKPYFVNGAPANIETAITLTFKLP
jgi:TonB family protein